MLDLKFIRENSEKVKKNISNKNENASVDIILELDEKRRSIIQDVELLKNKRNVVSNEIAQLKKAKQSADEQILAMKECSDQIKQYDDNLRTIELELDEVLLKVPNMLNPDVPIGRDESFNIEVRHWGEPKKQAVKKDHIEISKSLGILDFDRGAKVTGSGFAFYVGKGAALERAIISFMLDLHTEKHGYTELLTPIIVNRTSMIGTGQIPKLAEDMYYCEKDDLYLIPTAEVPITNYFAGDVLKNEDLPTKMCGFSQCFRREAGSYGKDTRGFLEFISLIKWNSSN